MFEEVAAGFECEVLFMAYKQLVHVQNCVFAIVGTPGREQNFNDRAQQLQQFSTRAAKTARMVAAGGSSGNKKLAEALLSSASQVCARVLLFTADCC